MRSTRIFFACLCVALLSLSITTGTAAEENSDTRRQLDALKLILKDADSAANAAERTQLLREFLTKSDSFVRNNPGYTNIWVVRATAALEVGDKQTAWEAGQKLLEYHLDQSDDSKVRNIMATLERRNLLGQISPRAAAEAQQRQVLQEAAEADKLQAVRQQEEESRKREEKRKSLLKWAGTWNAREWGRKLKSSTGNFTIALNDNLDLSISGSISIVIDSRQSLVDRGIIKCDGKFTAIGGEPNEVTIRPQAEALLHRDNYLLVNGTFNYQSRYHSHVVMKQAVLHIFSDNTSADLELVWPDRKNGWELDLIRFEKDK